MPCVHVLAVTVVGLEAHDQRIELCRGIDAESAIEYIQCLHPVGLIWWQAQRIIFPRQGVSRAMTDLEPGGLYLRIISVDHPLPAELNLNGGNDGPVRHKVIGETELQIDIRVIAAWPAFLIARREGCSILIARITIIRCQHGQLGYIQHMGVVLIGFIQRLIGVGGDLPAIARHPYLEVQAARREHITVRCLAIGVVCCEARERPRRYAQNEHNSQ